MDDESGTQAYCFIKYFQNPFLLYYVLVLGRVGTFLTYLYVMFSNNAFPVGDAKNLCESGRRHRFAEMLNITSGLAWFFFCCLLVCFPLFFRGSVCSLFSVAGSKAVLL